MFRKRIRAPEGREPNDRARLIHGAAAGPLFIAGFIRIGSRREGYDWRRHAVSSLADGREGWRQRANFIVTGLRYCAAARALARSPKQLTGPRAVPVLVFGAGAALIGSGLFVTDPAGGFPPEAPPELTLGGQLHNVCAIPIFAGIPAAALVSAGAALRRGEQGWAWYSAAAAGVMASSIVLFGAGLNGSAPRLAPVAGLFQRVSIASGFGWLSVLSGRALDPIPARGPRQS